MKKIIPAFFCLSVTCSCTNEQIPADLLVKPVIQSYTDVDTNEEAANFLAETVDENKAVVFGDSTICVVPIVRVESNSELKTIIGAPECAKVIVPLPDSSTAAQLIYLGSQDTVKRKGIWSFKIPMPKVGLETFYYTVLR